MPGVLASPLASPSSNMHYLAGLLLSLCLHVVRGQSGADISCSAKHVSNWGDELAELRIEVSHCDNGYLEWTLPKGHLKVMFEDEWRREFTVCLEQMDVSPWTAIRNITHEVDNRMEPLKLPIGRPTCATSKFGQLNICVEKPLLRVYRTSLYFDVTHR